MNSRIWRFVACLGGAVTVAASALLLPSGAQAQSTDTASLVGVVTDSLQAAVPGVTLTARQVNTGLTRTTVSNERGFYRLLALPPGEYELTAELSGFSVAKRTGVKLTVGAEAAIDFTLQPGGMSEEVTVKADVPIVETTTSQTGGTLLREQLDLLPTLSRDFRAFLSLVPGTTASERRRGVPRCARPFEPLADRRRGQQLRFSAVSEHHAAARLYCGVSGPDARTSRPSTAAQPAAWSTPSPVRVRIPITGGCSRTIATKTCGRAARSRILSVAKAPFQRLYTGGTLGGPIQRRRPISSSRSSGTTRTRTRMRPLTCRHRTPLSRTRRCNSSPVSASAPRALRRGRHGSSSSAHRRSRPTRRCCGVTFRPAPSIILTGRYTFDGFDQDAGDLETLFDFNASNTTRRNHLVNLNHKWILSGARLERSVFPIRLGSASRRATMPSGCRSSPCLDSRLAAARTFRRAMTATGCT